MPLFMDFHKIENITIDDVLKAHMADLAIQEKYGVKYHQFWVNQKEGTVFCLTEGPDAKTCELVHQIAHGNLACAITEVQQGLFNLFMGEKQNLDVHGMVKNSDGSIDLGYRTILVASVRGIAEVLHSRDLSLLQIPYWAKHTVNEKIREFHGREIEWADDSLIGIFNESSKAVACAHHIQQKLLSGGDEVKVVFKIGISADQPLNENGEFFAKAIKGAHRLCTTAGENAVLVSALVNRLCKDEARPASSHFKYLDAPDERFVYSLLDMADRNLSDRNFSVENICKNMGMSRPQFYRKVTSLTGRAPNYFMRDIRLEKAFTLLKQRAGNIMQVALDVGYNSPSYFTKCFTGKFGCTPSELLFDRQA